MRKLKVQIIDSSEAFCISLAEALEDSFVIETCTDGFTAVQEISHFCPDILVLSTILPGNDGLHILSEIRAAGICPLVLLTTPIVSEYVVEMAQELKVSHIMCKPCNIGVVADSVRSFREKLNGSLSIRSKDREAVHQLLIHLGFRVNLCGFSFLEDAILCLRDNRNLSMSKEVYPAVAKKYKGSWQQIERGIRVSVTDAWEKRNEEVWRQYFPADSDGLVIKPTNSMVIMHLAEGISKNGNIGK